MYLSTNTFSNPKAPVYLVRLMWVDKRPWRVSKLKNMLTSGRGHPNYVPEWELYEKDGQWFHVDDHLGSNPLPISGDNRKNSDGSKRPAGGKPSPFTSLVYLPYSLSPPNIPFALRHDWFGGESSSRTKGLGDVEGPVRDCFEGLYGVPSDHRIRFGYQAQYLRYLHQQDRLQEHLDACRLLLERLRSVGGWIAVEDYDAFGHSYTYAFGNYNGNRANEGSWVSTSEYWPGRAGFATREARQAELDHLNILPNSYMITHVDTGWSFLGSPSGGPWMRVVTLQGFELVAKSFETSHKRPGPNDMPRFWEPLFQRDCHTYNHAFRMHLSAVGRTDTANPYFDRRVPFHITWYCIIQVKPTDLTRDSLWESGPLYDAGSGEQLQKEAFTLLLEGERADFSTLLVLIPERRPGHSSSKVKYPELIPQVPALVLDTIWDALYHLGVCWETVETHLNRTVGEDQNAIFDPEKHDGLLFDDHLFSKSRRYFWAINSLNTFIDSIDNTLTQWAWYWEARGSDLRELQDRIAKEAKLAALSSLPPLQVEETNKISAEESIEYGLKMIDVEIRRLRNIQQRFIAMREKVNGLRDGVST